MVYVCVCVCVCVCGLHRRQDNRVHAVLPLQVPRPVSLSYPQVRDILGVLDVRVARMHINHHYKHTQ
jgi:hypothetical protein